MTEDTQLLLDRVKRLEALVEEARRIILAVGESHYVPIQMAQHGWLKTAQEVVPLVYEYD